MSFKFNFGNLMNLVKDTKSRNISENEILDVKHFINKPNFSIPNDHKVLYLYIKGLVDTDNTLNNDLKIILKKYVERNRPLYNY